jgi:hypothetical protein
MPAFLGRKQWSNCHGGEGFNILQDKDNIAAVSSRFEKTQSISFVHYIASISNVLHA